MIGTGRVWATSAISAPSVTTISTPRRSAASAIVSEKVRHLRFGSVPSSRTRSRSAPGARAAMKRVAGHSIWRVSPSVEGDRRPVRLEVEELLGVDLGDQLGVERVGDGLQGGRGGRGGVVPARGRRRRGPGSEAAAGSPSQTSGSIGLSVDDGASGSRGRMRAWRPQPTSAPPRRPSRPSPSSPPGSASAAATPASRKDRLTARNGSAYLALELRDRDGHRSRRGSSATSTGSPPASSAATRSAVAGGRALPRRARSPSSRTSDASTPAELDPADFLPAAYRDREELEGFLEHLTREVHDPGLRAVVERVLFTRPGREPSSGARPAPAAATTPTSAA